MKDLSSENQADVIKAFNSTSRYLDDLLNEDIKMSIFKSSENIKRKRAGRSDLFWIINPLQ